MATSLSLSFTNMSSATLYQYRGTSSADVTGWKIGYATNQLNYNLCIKFTPSVTLSKVVFTLTADSYNSGDSKHCFYLLRTSSSHPGVGTIDGGTNFKFSSKKATITLNQTFTKGTAYYLWLGATEGTQATTVILYNSAFACSSTIATYTVTFNANGGTTTKASQTVNAGSAVTLPTTAQCTRDGYNLLGFSTSSTATSASYNPGASYTPTAAITLYAVWKVAGLVYIDDGTTFVGYLIYIDNGTGWDQYIPYIDNGTGWDACY